MSYHIVNSCFYVSFNLIGAEMINCEAEIFEILKPRNGEFIITALMTLEKSIVSIIFKICFVHTLTKDNRVIWHVGIIVTNTLIIMDYTTMQKMN